MTQKKGKVWLIGAGPGDAGLLSGKGRQVLEDADVIVFDKLAGIGILSSLPAGAEYIDVGKIAGHHPVPQEEINQILLKEALKGKKVARLKGGDPFLFGRGGEELSLLKAHGIPFEIVPGITSAIAVPAYAGIPVTHRDYCSSLHIITAHTKKGLEPDIDYQALVRLDGTLVFLMGVAALPNVCQGLINAGMDPRMPAAIIENGTTAVQRQLTANLADLYEKTLAAGIGAPAVIVIGRVAALADKLAWFKEKPLSGLRVVVTRQRHQAPALTAKLTAQGVEVIEYPCIMTSKIADNEPLTEALAHIDKYSWLIFTSPVGVETFWEGMSERRFDVRQLSGLKIAAIGQATALAVEQKGVLVDFVPSCFAGKVLAEELCGYLGPDDYLLIARAREGAPELTQVFDKAGVAYDDLPVYETSHQVAHLPCLTEWIKDLSMDYVAFTSASTVRGFAEAVQSMDYTKVKALCIGEMTARQAAGYGMQTYVAAKATMDSMVEKLLEIQGGMENDDD